ncbi:unnamed protein product, partial [Protopolystoma xenopodis]
MNALFGGGQVSDWLPSTQAASGSGDPAGVDLLVTGPNDSVTSTAAGTGTCNAWLAGLPGRLNPGLGLVGWLAGAGEEAVGYPFGPAGGLGIDGFGLVGLEAGWGGFMFGGAGGLCPIAGGLLGCGGDLGGATTLTAGGSGGGTGGITSGLGTTVVGVPCDGGAFGGSGSIGVGALGVAGV